MRGAEAIP